MSAGQRFPKGFLDLITRDLLRRRREAREMRSSLVVEALEAQRTPIPSERSDGEAPAGTGSDARFLLASAAFQRIVDIDDALARIATGDFGQCVECGADISYQRLRALPTATTCYSCPKPVGQVLGIGSDRSMDRSLL